jgi:tetratricopeptide (TPR) repeat protein
MGRKKRNVSAADLKEQGNRAYSNREFDKALEFYNKAIEADLDNAVLYSNRKLQAGSAALVALHRYEEALIATDSALRLQPEYARAFVRKSNALRELSRFDEALEAVEAAIRLEPNDAALVTCKEEILRDREVELTLPLGEG